MEKCPKCGNQSLVEWAEVAYNEERSVKTGRVLKRSKTGFTTCWGYKCKCGWVSETFTE